MRHRGPARVWGLARGLHRQLARFFFVVALVSVAAGVAAAEAVRSGVSGWWLAGVAAFVLVVSGPLSWFATWRIARPLRDLARVAADLHRGRLSERGALPSAEGEVGEVADALRGLADRLSDQLAAQRALMAAVSHELRSPLARVRVLVEMTREGSAPDGWLDVLEGEVLGMDRLVGDLLAAARIDFEAVQLRPLEVGDVVARAVELSGGSAEVRVDDAAVEVRADPTLLVRALVLMLDNAARHGGGAVTIRALGRGSRVRFVVEDDGPGFVVGEADRVFDPFFRGARVGAEGVGLGLALVRQIATAHGGASGAENRPGGGAAVWVEVEAVGG